MNPNVQKIIIGLAIAGALAGIYFLFFKKKNALKDLEEQASAGGGGGGGGSGSPAQKTLDAKLQIVSDDSFPLKEGSRGERIKTYQGLLNQKLGTSLAKDGIFGAKTKSATLKYFGKAEVTEEDYRKLLLDITTPKTLYRIPASVAIKDTTNNINNRLFYGNL